jgi:antitoxin YefM
MLVATLSDFRKEIKNYLDTVSNNFETLIINRGKNKGIVIMSMEEYNSLIAAKDELTVEMKNILDQRLQEDETEYLPANKSMEMLNKKYGI